MPKINIDKAPAHRVCAYPEPYNAHCNGRSKQALGDAGGLTQFGVNLTRLAPGAASAHQHWHQHEDEFIYMLEGEAVLVEDDGERVLKQGDAASFRAGVANGHMLVNKSAADAIFLEVGTRAAAEVVNYTDPAVDLRMEKKAGGAWIAQHKNGEPY